MSEIKPGDVVLGKYRVERVLGQGAMGCVLAVMNVDLEQRFAIKLMKASRAPAEAHARFVREAKITAKLRSEHAVKVLDVGTTEGGEPYMLMEHLEGRDLADELRARGPLPVGEAVEHILQACEALAEAHAAGVVHRDIKPANLFLARGAAGRVVLKVLDFGVSKLAGDGALTGDLAALGSPLYMSPEQMNASKDVDARCDVWALGVTLFELLVGRTPFHADTIHVVVAQVGLKDPPPLAPLRPDLPAGLEAVIRACLEKTPERRMASVAALAAALAPFGPERAKRHAEQAAAVLGEQVAPARPTVELPPAESATRAGVLTAPLPPAALTATTGGRAALAQATLSTSALTPPKRRRGVFAAAAAALAAGGALAAALVGGRGRAVGPSLGAGTIPEPPASSPAQPRIEAPRAELPEAGASSEAAMDAGAPAATATASARAAEAAPPKNMPAVPKGAPKPEPRAPAETTKPAPVKPPGTTYNL
ncbi:Serine/threonine-protein kinase pkn3 [Minicystis rosea]|nr:Serine/threonine-protein kinase pkn3 [Minicystis rosea]